MSPLKDVRVLDISTFFSAPLVASLLGDFGAEVIKIEPPAGDPYRGTHLWPLIARNKKSVTLNLTTEEGCKTLRDLADRADVIVENLSEDTLRRRGLTWAETSKRNPRLIMLSLSCFGQTGPYAGRPGNGTMGEAFAGLTHLIGPADDAPVLPSVALGDAVGALSAAFGIVTALYWRDARGGTGQHIDASLYEPILYAISQAVARWTPGHPPRRMSNRLPDAPLRNVYVTADQHYVVIGLSSPRQLRSLLSLIGASSDSEPDAAVAEWVRQHTRGDVLATIVEHGLPAVPVQDLEQLLADPHVQARGSLKRIDDPDYGTVALPAPSPLLSRTPGTLNWIAAPLGAHNEEVLSDMLGLDRKTRDAVTTHS